MSAIGAHNLEESEDINYHQDSDQTYPCSWIIPLVTSRMWNGSALAKPVSKASSAVRDLKRPYFTCIRYATATLSRAHVEWSLAAGKSNSYDLEDDLFTTQSLFAYLMRRQESYHFWNLGGDTGNRTVPRFKHSPLAILPPPTKKTTKHPDERSYLSKPAYRLKSFEPYLTFLALPTILLDPSLSRSLESAWCHATRVRKAVVLVCKARYSVGINDLYREVVIRRINQIPALLSTLQNNNAKALLVESLRVFYGVPRDLRTLVGHDYSRITSRYTRLRKLFLEENIRDAREAGQKSIASSSVLAIRGIRPLDCALFDSTLNAESTFDSMYEYESVLTENET
ncbi:hypothetical protein BS17DRAFT_880787 [Gyrodon lividus]|nr:hypothetical protein BS17DRAFT_880787 [Gyrodon lividus]